MITTMVIANTYTTELTSCFCVVRAFKSSPLETLKYIILCYDMSVFEKMKERETKLNNLSHITQPRLTNSGIVISPYSLSLLKHHIFLFRRCFLSKMPRAEIEKISNCIKHKADVYISV